MEFNVYVSAEHFLPPFFMKELGDDRYEIRVWNEETGNYHIAAIIKGKAAAQKLFDAYGYGHTVTSRIPG